LKLFAGLTAAEIHRVVSAEGGAMTGLFVNGDIIARQQDPNNPNNNSPNPPSSSNISRAAAGLSSAAAAAARDPFRGGGPGRLPRFSSMSGGGGGGGVGSVGGVGSAGGWVDDDCMVVVLSGMAAVAGLYKLNPVDPPIARKRLVSTLGPIK
jgi:hypothetical protein